MITNISNVLRLWLIQYFLQTAQYATELNLNSQWPRVHRSVSMGQAGARDLAQAAHPPLTKNIQAETQDTLSGTCMFAEI